MLLDVGFYTTVEMCSIFVNYMSRKIKMNDIIHGMNSLFVEKFNALFKNDDETKKKEINLIHIRHLPFIL